jgi:hypothetical protein
MPERSHFFNAVLAIASEDLKSNPNAPEARGFQVCSEKMSSLGFSMIQYGSRVHFK